MKVLCIAPQNRAALVAILFSLAASSCYRADAEALAEYTVNECEIVPFNSGCYSVSKPDEQALIASELFFAECVTSKEQQDCILQRSCDVILPRGYGCGVFGDSSSICNPDFNVTTDECVVGCRDDFSLCGNGEAQCESEPRPVVEACVSELRDCLSTCS